MLYDKNGNCISSKKHDEKLDYLYDTENRLLAVKDKDGLLMAALYDGDDNRVFTASRKEGKHTYQLFKREEKKKSPYTSPNGEEHSLFWYGFSQNVLQALSSFPQTVGTIWHDLFEDVSTAYHQKVAKDRADSEGLVINPPDLGNVPGEGDVTYASQVKEVLIPYTTREDTFNYYEERNYVNDVNRAHTEVLQTYDRELKARETYTYGQGRVSYLNHETGDHYHYLSNQAGSVTGLTKDGVAVASSSYSLYGLTKQSTDETGNPFAYNGEARDITGLDYLRARYYDSRAGTFLTEDSYAGQATDPLSQNRYAYVHNNPVNYTDPSGHVASSPFTMFLGGGKPRYTQPRPLINYENGTLYAPNTPENKAHQIRQQQTGVYSYTYVPTYVPTASAYQYIQQQESQVRAQAHAQAVRYRQQQIRHEYAQSTGHYGTPKTREAANLLRNWGKALKETYTHVCQTAERVGKQTMKSLKKVDWKKVAVTAGAIGVGIALTVATGGLGAPIAMAIGGAASGAIISGYDAYSSGQRGWALAGAIGKGAGLGAITGFAGGSLMGAGSGIATSVTQNISNQAVRQVAKAGVEAGIETAIDTGLDLATGNKIAGQTVAMNFAYNLVSNGASSVSTKKAPKVEINTRKPKVEDFRTKIDNQVIPIAHKELPKSLTETFTNGNYRTVITDEDVILYRTFGGNADASGAFATTTPAQNRIQAKIDTALKPEWKNSRMYEAEIRVPKGEVLNIGQVAPQKITSTGTILKGGADQILLPKDWPLEWITDIHLVPN